MGITSWEIVAVFVPLGALVGMAAAVLSLTSWAIMLPVLLMAFDLPVEDALFVCFCIDALNGTYVAYRYRARLDYGGAVVLAVLAAAVAVATAQALGKEFVTQHTALLRHGAGYGDFVGGVIFFVRGCRTRGLVDLASLKEPLVEAALDCQRDELSSCEGQASGSMLLGTDTIAPVTAVHFRRADDPGLPLSDHRNCRGCRDSSPQACADEYSSRESSGSAVSSRFSTITIGSSILVSEEAADEVARDRMSDVTGPSTRLTVSDADHGAGGGMRDTMLIAADDADFVDHADEVQMAGVNGTSHNDGLLQQLRYPASPTHAVRLALVLLGAMCVGFLCGMLGFGAGTIFMLLYILLLGSTTLEGAATGNAVMALLMLAMLCTYAPDLQSSQFKVYLCVSASTSLVGAAIASRYTVQLSESKLSFCVSSLMFGVGILDVCWQQLIDHHTN